MACTHGYDISVTWTLASVNQYWNPVSTAGSGACLANGAATAAA
jgi:hypothetical protein